MISLDIVVTCLFCVNSIFIQYFIKTKVKKKKKLGNYIVLQISVVLKKTEKRSGPVFGHNVSKVSSLFCAYHNKRMTGKAQV